MQLHEQKANNLFFYKIHNKRQKSFAKYLIEKGFGKQKAISEWDGDLLRELYISDRLNKTS